MQEFFATYLAYAKHVLMAVFDPSQRIFYLYLATSILVAFGVYSVHRARKSAETPDSFVAFLFPKSVWGHPSAWLDVRYFFFHKLIGHFLMFGLLAGAAAMVFRLMTGVSITSLPTTAQGGLSWVIVIAYMFVSTLVSDFIGWGVHYLQHKVPILWEFHKVHHSAEVMHPLSNYREHPIDNLLYQLCIGLGYGAVTGGAYLVLDVVPSLPSILGVPVLMFLFNILAYNLRHSHIWLRWPGVWSKVFPSPAHHHVHHSCHPAHFDKNFAFLFPIWDVIFGTYIMPDDNRDVKFGVAGMKSMEMDSCWKLYSVPFVKAARRLRKKKTQTKVKTTGLT
ncbi:sterol desaturase family protein [Epibacterium ulvae]|uniref:sterol desaturase family protein n=1 Tax=Epibacterium ulvae TaxID=1156985 RepID=UPI001BFC364C|nr:sterol desaturase family protein [Epibacterium ulvae]